MYIVNLAYEKLLQTDTVKDPAAEPWTVSERQRVGEKEREKERGEREKESFFT